MLFLGKHDYSMDDRGRVPMPPRFREALMRGIILTQGTPDRCIRAYPLDEFEKTAANYMSEPITTPAGRVMRRNFFSGAYQAELDRQGRVLVPPVLRQFASLDSQVVVLGAGDAIELWDASTYDTALQDEAGEYRQSLGSE
ncbi:MAG TPA: division/cell wall cluster transcriptional repressor MraZ [Dehalococcoidia bacterium]|nr:division/cell wall cluster transcriptional repressor MraZ [Dehalococcoidia bacterium]